MVNLIPAKSNDQKLAYFAVVCEYKSDNGYYLFYCDENWVEFADTWHESMVDAQDQAQYDYNLLADQWHYK